MTVICGDNIIVLGGFPSNSFGYVVTDPPYGLSRQPKLDEVLSHWLAGDDYHASGGGFMGKSWDSFVPGPATWREVLRVMKPGAYALVFAGSRTNYLMTTALKLAGFEILDQLFWLYGSGFPKSLDVATRANFDKLRPFFRVATPEWIERMVDQRTYESENLKRRPVVGHHEKPAQASEWRANYEGGNRGEAKDITEAYSPEAKAWEGWGTGLKPAFEPIILARKPLDGTYANNIMQHGCGALNIEGCANGERWPANVMHDGCLPEPMDRYYYCAKATKADRNAGLEDLATVPAGEITGGRAEGSAGLNSPRAGAGRKAGSKNPHPTVKPTDLMRWLVRLVATPEQVGLDPFAGSGSTLRAAKLEGHNMLGIELDAKFAEIARAREDNIK